MSVFEIDHFHPLSGYHVDEEKNESIMNSTFKKFLFKPIVLDNIFEPNELKKTFEIAFELELMGILAEITSGICKENDISLPEKNIICKNVSGPFSTMLGVDNFQYGWNIYGILLSTEKNISSLGKDEYVLIITYLLQYFKTNHNFAPFYHRSDKDLYRIIKDDMKRKPDKKHYKVENFEWKDFEVNQVYKWCKLYKNSVLYIIQKIYSDRVPIWENENILNEIKRFVHKLLDLPDVNDTRCNNNLMHVYSTDKLKLPTIYRRKIEVLENKRLTSSELYQMRQYTPFHQDDVFLVDKDSEYHLEYNREIIVDTFTFSNMLQAIHYKMLCIYFPRSTAFEKSSSLTFQNWDKTLVDYFKKHFNRFGFMKMNDIKYRLSLLQTDDKQIVMNDKIDYISGFGENFLGKLLMDIRTEMKDYMSDEGKDYILHKESILFFLNKWLEIWKDCNIVEEDKIHFFFEFYFSNLEYKAMQNASIFPVILKNPDNHDIINGYLHEFYPPSNIFQEEVLLNVFDTRTNTEMLDYMQKHWDMFFKFQKDMVKHFQFVKKNEMILFHEQKQLHLKKYIALKNFLQYE
jgi:hypothetical protein